MSRTFSEAQSFNRSAPSAGRLDHGRTPISNSSSDRHCAGRRCGAQRCEQRLLLHRSGNSGTCGNVDPQSGAQGEFKTPDGRVKPQAARFRIFEYEKETDGKFHPIGEVKTSDTARAVKITWTVHLANRKASFCTFHGQAGAEDNPLVRKLWNAPKPKIEGPQRKLKTSAERKKSSSLTRPETHQWRRCRNGSAFRDRSGSEAKRSPMARPN